MKLVSVNREILWPNFNDENGNNWLRQYAPTSAIYRSVRDYPKERLLAAIVQQVLSPISRSETSWRWGSWIVRCPEKPQQLHLDAARQQSKAENQLASPYYRHSWTIIDMLKRFENKWVAVSTMAFGPYKCRLLSPVRGARICPGQWDVLQISVAFFGMVTWWFFRRASNDIILSDRMRINFVMGVYLLPILSRKPDWATYRIELRTPIRRCIKFI